MTMFPEFVVGSCVQLDALKVYPNVLVLTTSNITEAIDLAFVDRADIKAYIGPPGLKVGAAICLAHCVCSLCRQSQHIMPHVGLGSMPSPLSSQQGL